MLNSRQALSGPPPTHETSLHHTSTVYPYPVHFPRQPPCLPNQPNQSLSLFSRQRLSMPTQSRPISYGPSPIHLSHQPLPFSSSNQSLSNILKHHTVPSSSHQPHPIISQPPQGFNSSQPPKQLSATLPATPPVEISSFICLHIQGMSPGAYSRSRWKVPRLSESLLTKTGPYVPL